MLSNFKGFFLEMSIWLGLNFATPLLLHEHAGDETPFLLRNFAPLCVGLRLRASSVYHPQPLIAGTKEVLPPTPLGTLLPLQSHRPLSFTADNYRVGL